MLNSFIKTYNGSFFRLKTKSDIIFSSCVSLDVKHIALCLYGDLFAGAAVFSLLTAGRSGELFTKNLTLREGLSTS